MSVNPLIEVNVRFAAVDLRCTVWGPLGLTFDFGIFLCKLLILLSDDSYILFNCFSFDTTTTMVLLFLVSLVYQIMQILLINLSNVRAVDSILTSPLCASATLLTALQTLRISFHFQNLEPLILAEIL